MSILDLIILIPIIASIAILMGSPARLTSMLAAGANLGLGLLAYLRFDPAGTGYQFAASRRVLASPEISYAVGADGLSLVMILLTVVVTLAAIWMSPRLSSGEPLFYASSLLISAGALGAFCTTDLFFFYAFHELALIPTFLMIGIFGTGDNKAAAWKITIYLGLGSVVLLAGLLGLYFVSGSSSFDIATLGAAAATGIDAAGQRWVFLVLLIGFGTLISLFPFHSWAAPAYASAPAPTAMLHAGVLKKFGLYGLIRLAVPMLPEGAAYWTDLVLILLLGNVLYVGLVTVASRRLDEMLANSSVMHMGYVFLGIISMNAIGTNGAILLMFAHGVSIALLFGLCGKLRAHYGTLEFEKMGGLGKVAPFFGLAFGFAAFASAGLPGFANFAGEIMIFFGAFQSYAEAAEKTLGNLQKTTILALWGVVISAIYMLRGYRAIFMGTASRDSELHELGGLQRVPVLILLAALIAAGFFPSLLLQLLQSGTETLTAITGL